jgi:hypothetical protein
VGNGHTDAVALATLEQALFDQYTGDDNLDPNSTVSTLSIQCSLGLPVTLAAYSHFYTSDGYGQAWMPNIIPSGQVTPLQLAEVSVKAFVVGQLMLVRTVATGSLAAAFVVRDTSGSAGPIIIRGYDNIKPNKIPAPDQLTDLHLVPLGSPRFLVGVGTATPVGKPAVTILHEQYWRPSTSSFPIAPGETKKIVLVHRSGVSDTSTSETQIGTSLNADVSGGWGPISASISAAFSMSEQTTHSRTLSDLNESTTELELTNTLTVPQLVIYWELVDDYVLVGSDGTVIGTIESIQAPPLVRVYAGPPAATETGNGHQAPSVATTPVA